MTSWRKPLFLVAAVGLLALAAWNLPVREWASQINPLVTVPVAALLLSALVPRTAISLAMGALFGTFFGAGLSLAAAVLAAVACFATGSWAGRALLERKAGPRLRAVDGWLARRGLLAVIVVRLLPIAPFGLVSYAYGASSTRFRDFFLGTAIGGLPSSLSYATIGAAAVSPGTMSWLTFAPAAFGVLLSSGAALYWRRTQV
jgi:uncharacterized membrane protein YdjX (TVP38/TMEM64 family)